MSIGLLSVLLATIGVSGSNIDPESHINRGVRFIIGSQNPDGSFGESGASTGDVGTTGLAIQALASSMTDQDPLLLRAIGKALRFLESRIQPDGLVYDAEEGLRVFKTAMAAKAFRASRLPRYQSRAAELFSRIGSSARLESQSDSRLTSTSSTERRDDAEGFKLLSGARGTDESTDRAIDFLLQLDSTSLNSGNSPRPVEQLQPNSIPGYISYESLPSLVYRDLTLEDPDVIAVLKALREKFTLIENPDLTRRFSMQSKPGGGQGLYFNIYVIARCLSLLPSEKFETDSGETHCWASELSSRLMTLQRADGSWLNQDPRWWEGRPVIATAYAVLALRQCQDRLRTNEVDLPSPLKK